MSRRQLYTLRDHGRIEPLARGLYRRQDAPAADLGLIAVAQKAPRATICLATALARHGLTDAIPAANDVAIPCGTRHPVIDTPVQSRRGSQPGELLELARQLPRAATPLRIALEVLL